MTELRITEEADRHIEQIRSWWAENRPATDLFARELLDALTIITKRPHSGSRYAVHRSVEIRRLLLTKSGYHVYFAHDEEADLIFVRAVWYASRGTLPQL